MRGDKAARKVWFVSLEWTGRRNAQLKCQKLLFFFGPHHAKERGPHHAKERLDSHARGCRRRRVARRR